MKMIEYVTSTDNAPLTFPKASLLHIAVLVFASLKLFWVDLLQLADVRPVVVLVAVYLCDYRLGGAARCPPSLLLVGEERVPGWNLPGLNW